MNDEQIIRLLEEIRDDQRSNTKLARRLMMLNGGATVFAIVALACGAALFLGEPRRRLLEIEALSAESLRGQIEAQKKNAEMIEKSREQMEKARRARGDGQPAL
jgi:histidine ammonia-lyase